MRKNRGPKKDPNLNNGSLFMELKHPNGFCRKKSSLKHSLTSREQSTLKFVKSKVF